MLFRVRSGPLLYFTVAAIACFFCLVAVNIYKPSTSCLQYAIPGMINLRGAQTLSGEASDHSWAITRARLHTRLKCLWQAIDRSSQFIFCLNFFFIVSKKYTCVYFICLDIIVWYKILIKKSRVVTKIFLSSVMTRFHQQLFEDYEYLMAGCNLEIPDRGR